MDQHMKKTSSPPSTRAPDAGTRSVRTPKAVRYGALLALLGVALLAALVFLGPKGEDRWGAASRPTLGDKVAPATAPASDKR